MTNPLLAAFDGPFGLPPFAALTDDDFAPAFAAALTDARLRTAVEEELEKPQDDHRGHYADDEP